MLGKAWNNLLRVGGLVDWWIGGLVDGATLIHPTRLKPIPHQTRRFTAKKSRAASRRYQ